MKFEFRFPDIGEGIAEGTLIKWLVKEGDEIEEGQSVAEVETDKVTTEIPSAKKGKVLELEYEEGDTIEVGKVLIMLDTSDGSSDEGTTKVPEYDEEDKKQELEEKKEIVEEETAGVVGEVVASSEEIPASTEGQSSSSKKETNKKVLATPVARKLAKDLGVDIGAVEGTGPNGRVMKEDINKFKSEKPASSVSEKQTRKLETLHIDSSLEEKTERIPLTRIRKTISEQMSKSRFTIPHTTAME